MQRFAALLVALLVALAACDYGKKNPKKDTQKDAGGQNAGGKGSTEKVEPAVQVESDAFFKHEVKADEGNDSVTAEERANPQPVRGGTLRIRLPTFPHGLNRHLMNHATAEQAEMNSYMNAYLVNVDPETLENMPFIARHWETQDVLDLVPEGAEEKGEGKVEKGGKVVGYERRYGRVESVEEGKPVVFWEGGRLVTVAQFEARLDKDKGTLALGHRTFKIRGAVKSPGKYTWQFEDVSAAKRVEVPWARIARKSWSMGAGPTRKAKPGVREACRHTFHLREGNTWHDGKPLTVEDVIFTVEKILKNRHVDARNIQNYYDDLEKVIAPDPRTLVFEWSKPYFQSLILSGQIEVVAKHFYWKDDYDLKTFGEAYNKHPGNDAPLGNGPYKFVKWDKASHIEMEHYPEFFASQVGFPYWRKDQPYIDRMKWVVIKSALATLKGFEAGDVDLDKDVEPDTWDAETPNSKAFLARFVKTKTLQPLYTYVGWNLRREYFQDKRVRQALTMLTPLKEIADTIHKGLAFQVTGPFFYNSPAYDKSIKPWPYDPERARELLKEAGFADRNGDGWLDYKDKQGNIRTFEFEYLIHTARQYHEDIAVKVQEGLKKGGIKVNIRKIDWTIFGKQVHERKVDAFRFAWGANVDPDPYQQWHSSEADTGSNYVGYKNPVVDDLIETARITFNSQKRWTLLKKVHRIIHEDQPYTFMFLFYTLSFYDKQMRGVKYYPTSSYGPDLTEWWIPRRFQAGRKN